MLEFAAGYIFAYFFLSLCAALLFGPARTLGFFRALIVCVLFSPWVGAIICHFYPEKDKK